MNQETRAALRFLQDQMSGQRTKLVEKRDALLEDARDLDGQIRDYERRLTAIGEDLRKP